ncbi:hypothetical protein K443DRAFT_108121 [Laccaria amethystina LaAM-08-1]|uniref:RNA exonuclease 4 n=1 Tax=Laccaria amethystina LaAM-08-1 TaxID=1095629 RepID=A0A0C9XIC6_9AGAR|nr:hypothetical protein K443DRAFT_108121 [Laccaria amethystina LaAM-08-1]
MSSKLQSSGAIPSSNWRALQKTLGKDKKSAGKKSVDGKSSSRKRRKLEHAETEKKKERSPSSSPEPVTKKSWASRVLLDDSAASLSSSPDIKNGESLSALRDMVHGRVEYNANQRLPGKYLAIDCEMVGVGLEGAESSLARVSLVNFYGAEILDLFVRQRERVVDYRTQWSGIRDTDMLHAKPFGEVQKQVADLLEDRILVGHAVHNDLKALLLSHPWASKRDTQYYAYKGGLTKSKRIALRNLVKQELDLVIQEGEHSSVTDARATMAVFRLHRKDWEKGNRPIPLQGESAATAGTKRKRGDGDAAEKEEEGNDGGEVVKPSSTKKEKKKKKKVNSQEYPGGGRKGVSSGLSTVVRHGPGKEKEKTQWWKQLPTVTMPGSKGSVRIGKSTL